MLHGEIKINGDVIAHWRARRLQHLKGEHEVHDYECQVIDLSERTGEGLTFLVEHKYSDGAIDLAAKVLGVSQDYLS